jgi:hypothetical protein
MRHQPGPPCQPNSLNLFSFVLVLFLTEFYFCWFQYLFQVLKMESDKLRLIHSDREKIFEDEATIGDQEVANDDVVYVVYKKGESTEFESVSAGGKEDA